jgi:hypothetical protein
LRVLFAKKGGRSLPRGAPRSTATASPVNELRIDYLPLDALREHPRNPKSHNLDALQSSFRAYGFVDPLILDEASGCLVAGHGRLHALRRAREAGERPPARVVVDASGAWHVPVLRGISFDSEEQRDGFLIAANQTTILGGFLRESLAEFLADLDARGGDVLATGFSRADLDAMLAETGSAAAATNAVQEAGHLPRWTEQDQARAEAAGTRRAGLARPVSSDQTSLDAVPDKFAGALQIDEGVLYPIENRYGIPVLRSDRLVTELPSLPLRTFASTRATPPHEITDAHWVWNFGHATTYVPSMPWDRTWLGFFAYDEYFECWWDTPAYFVTKFVNLGCRAAFMPDFSADGTYPLAIDLFNLYRSFWLGRLMQDSGIAVVPVLMTIGVQENGRDVGTLGIPDGAPIIYSPLGSTHTEEQWKVLQPQLVTALTQLRPKAWIVYAGQHMKADIERLVAPHVPDVAIVFISRMHDELRKYKKTIVREQQESENPEGRLAPPSRRRLASGVRSGTTTE